MQRKILDYNTKALEIDRQKKARPGKESARERLAINSIAESIQLFFPTQQINQQTTKLPYRATGK
jgi:hypothetical protein